MESKNLNSKSESLNQTPKNLISKLSKEDPEEILRNQLESKFGQRFKKYRDNYNNNMTDYGHKLNFDYPLTVNLELVNRCNLECVMCHQEYRNNAQKHSFDNDVLDKIFEDFKKNQLSALMLSISEPLLFKNIESVIRRAENANIMDIFLFTNGALLNEKKANMILNSGITRLFISLDASTQKTYDEVRVPVAKRLLKENRLSYVEDNIKNFIKLRNNLGKKLPLVRVSFVAIEKNLHEIKEFKKKWIDIVDSVEVQMERPTEIFDHVREGDFSTDSELKLDEYNCTRPWSDIAIYADGAVAPCCAFVGRKAPIGNVKNNTIKEIWNGKKMNEIRDGFKNNTPIKVCQICLENEKFNVKSEA